MEAHLLGEENQLPLAGKLAENTNHIIFASGTYNKDTLSDIKFYTKLRIFNLFYSKFLAKMPIFAHIFIRLWEKFRTD